MIQSGRVCFHTREDEFDSQHAPSNRTSDHWIVGLGLEWSDIWLMMSAFRPSSVSNDSSGYVSVSGGSSIPLKIG